MALIPKICLDITPSAESQQLKALIVGVIACVPIIEPTGRSREIVTFCGEIVVVDVTVVQFHARAVCENNPSEVKIKLIKIRYIFLSLQISGIAR